jgi:hypothetical protein
MHRGVTAKKTQSKPPIVSSTCVVSAKKDMTVVCDQWYTVLTSYVTYLSGLQEV